LTASAPFNLLSRDRIELIEAWGMSRSSLAYVHRPSTVDRLRQVLISATEQGVTVAPRGAGCSYGDASLNAENVVLDMSRMNRILAWDPKNGRVAVESGVTIRQLWQYCIEDGWWPPVVPGTMFVTIGGGAAMNYHGKNNFKVGPIGDHIVEFDILLPTGALKTCRRDTTPELFHAAIGGFGMLGVFTRLVLQMKRVYSGLLKVDAFSTASFAEIINAFEHRHHAADYLVGWIDCFARGDRLGRGLVHQANYLLPGEDAEPAQTLRVANQELPDTMFGLLPKSVMGRMLQPFTNNVGMQMINAAKFVQGNTLGNHKSTLQPLAQFSFLLDYVPNWKFAYKPGALVQFQSFLPQERAEAVYRQQILLSQKAGIVPYLGVFKRHRPDSFLMTHAVEGYSLALDYPLSERNSDGLLVLVDRLADIVVSNGGRFYFAKDSLLSSRWARAFIGEDRLAKLIELKRSCDPNSVLETELSRRLLPELSARNGAIEPVPEIAPSPQYRGTR
jgi:decaprenylphospho-beta-D-ribofuranose 2-oxidase